MEISLSIYKNDGLNKLAEICSLDDDVKKFILNNEFSSIKSVESQEFQLNLKTQIPKLVFDKNIKQAEEGGNDGENAIRIHKWLGSDKIELFLDQRFWTYLCFNDYSDYCWNRWLKDATNDKKLNRLEERFLTFRGVQATRRMSINALGRLWLAAHLTYNDKSKDLAFFFKEADDDYKYTKLIFSNQNIYQQLTQRSYITRNKKIILSILYYMDERNIATKDNILYICKTLEIHLNNSRIALNTAQEILEVIDNIVDEKQIKSISLGLEKNQTKITLDLLGSYTNSSNIGKTVFYSYANGDKIKLKWSKDYAKKPYWYGITPQEKNMHLKEKATHFVFILGTKGFVKVSNDILENYLKQAKTSKKEDGSTKHWHINISNEELLLFTNEELDTFDLKPYFTSF